MLPDYQDIREIAGTPLWHDGYGVPRYAAFHPRMLGVYDTWAVLARIECQACALRMSVGEGWTRYDRYRSFREGDELPPEWNLDYLTENFRYGDPPWHECRGAGESMSSVGCYIEQAWERKPGGVWTRNPQFEDRDITPAWVTDPPPEFCDPPKE
ncbi:MAG: hypothetical protein WC054_00920 [Candidatus Nanopelagicales bacterium]